MAQKRMFSKKITDSDKFLDLPLSAQALYFHLNMHGDDDGFVDNTKTVKRMLGASDGDLRLLMDQNFIIPFESGIVVIKDWRIHNYIPKDRYKPTIHGNEFNRLMTAENGSYTECIQNVHSLDTQIRLDKNRLDEDREDTPPLVIVSEIYQSKIGVIDGDQFQQLTEYITLDGMELDAVVRAITEAADNGKRNFKYVLAILRNWKQNGIKTIAQVEERERQRIEQKASSFQNGNGSQPRQTNVPTWSTEPVKTEQTKEGQARLAEIFAELEAMEGADG
ncbi:DnaD domain protein [Streptococcus suis]|uniref:DnaD domain-containing protein n=1 Tax=Streptococcus suis TaxID=1307 RepID=UPI0015576B03|nr:DnaD domain protein [Streptococcus suis]MCB2944671.1 DnaD domain protein [Streptococcus suis]NQL90755.1 DnaD domain protein [Streptococcus suis]HEM4167956.1 DnaD domain protein [Streptococcus suis]